MWSPATRLPTAPPSSSPAGAEPTASRAPDPVPASSQRYRRVVDATPLDPDDWTDEQWQEHLQATADGDLGDDAPAREGEGAPGFRRLRGSGAGAVFGAAMQGLEQALYGERPKEEIVAESGSDDPDRERSTFDPDDPESSIISLAAEPPRPVEPIEPVEPTRPPNPT
jgi:hypothetical protein